jgi:hypothetical protein
MNTNLPQRTDAHLLEEGSRRRFQSALPKQWVVEETTRDYGVDATVEIFESNLTTGLRFNVQLKGQLKACTQPKVSIRRSSREYWKSLDAPTLLVLWDRATDRLWCCWSHQIDVRGMKPDAKSLTVNFSNEVTEDYFGEVLKEVRAHRATRQPMSNLPVLVTITAGAKFLGQDARPVAAAIRRLAAGIPDTTLEPARAGGVLSGEVFVDSASIRVRVAGTPGGELHYDSLKVKYVSADNLMVAADALCMMGVELGRLGLTAIGADMVSRTTLAASTAIRVESIETIVYLLSRARAVKPLIQLLKRIYVDTETETGTTAVITLIKASDFLTSENRLEIADSIRAGVARDEARSGQMLYNVAGFVKRDDRVLALQLYDEAAELNPAYKSRDYWWEEKGAMYFLTEQYVEAEQHYRRAFELGDLKAGPLLADALLRLGKYDLAISQFEEGNKYSTVTNPSWRLAEYAFRSVCDELDIHAQGRLIEHGICDEAPSSPDETDLMEQLKYDLLSPWVLWAIASVRRESGRPAAAFVIAAAWLAERIPPMWTEAITACADESLPLLTDVALASRQHVGDEIVAFVQ